MGIGSTEVIVIIIVIVILFGSTQIPKVARSLGEGLKEFKKAMKEAKEEDSENEEKPKQKRAPVKKVSNKSTKK
jgi:sec-independent protein translocase protein TatA